MLWSVGVSTMFVNTASAAVCPTLSAGDMVKVSGKAAIYSVNKNSQILYFPSGDEFKSWSGLSATAANQYAGYTTITQACFDSLSVPSSYPGAVNYRAASYPVRRPSSDQLYAVLPGNKLAKISTTDAAALYGANYKVMTVADAFWPHYVNRGADVMGTVHEGMLVSKDGKTWYVDAGMVLREVTATGMTANRFKSGWVRTVPASYLAGTTVGTQITALESVLTNRTQDGAIVAQVGGSLNVSLAADNPAAGTIADGSAYNKVLKLNLSASAATNVTGITLTKTGLISNANIAGVSVWDAQGNRHGDVMTSLTSDNKVTISFGSNPIMVGAGGSETLLVAVNINGDANSGLVGFSVGASTDVVSNGTVSGAFPVIGNQMTVVDGLASLGTVTITAGTVGGKSSLPLSTDSGNLQIGDLQKEVAKFRFTTGGNEDMTISKLTFYVAGSIQDADLANWTLVAPNGDTLAMTPAMSNRYVTLSLATPYLVPKSTSRDLTLKVDVVNGSTRNFLVHLQSDYDVMVKGVSTGFYVLPTSFTDTNSVNGWFNMGSGALVINKSATTPSGNISSGAQNIVLAKFDVKATGENMELRKMGLSVAKTNPTQLTGNVIVRDAADGTVYLTVAASTAALYTGGAQYSLSSYINVTANVNKVLEVVGSVDSTATSGNKYTVGIGDFYGRRLSTLDFSDAMPSAVNAGTVANQMTVNPTSLSCYKDTSMGSVTRATGATTVVGQFICSAGTSEDVRLSNVTVAFGGTDGTVANAYQNLSFWDGATQLGSTTVTPASTSNNFSFSLLIPKNQTKVLQLKAYLVPGQTAAITSSIFSASYTGVDSNNSASLASTPIIGQLVTIGNGTLNITVSTDDTTASKLAAPGQTGVQLGKWKFAAANDDITLSKLTVQAVNPSTGAVLTTLGSFGSLSLYDGSTLLSTGSYVEGNVVFNGINSTIPVSGSGYKVYTLKGTINDAATITNNTPVAFVIASDSNTDMEARSAAGSLLGESTINYNLSSTGGSSEVRFATNTAYNFHAAYPVIAPVSLGTTVAADSLAKIFKFTVTNPGTVDLKLSTTTVSVGVAGLATGGSISDVRLYSDNAGNLGTQLAAFTITITSSTSNPTSTIFGVNNDVNSQFENLVVAPGTTRTFIVTANTASMNVGRASGSTLTISSKIAGSAGWSGSAWNTGDLNYYYTAVSGGSQLGPFTASDSYEVTAPSLESKL